MNLKQLINKSVYGTIGYISSQEDIDLLEQYLIYNLPVLQEYKWVIVATNFKDKSLISKHNDVWGKYLDCTLLTSKINRGHNFGTADLDNLIFDYCKENNIEWLCKSANDVILDKEVLDIEIEEADFYYLNGISYEDLYLNKFDYNYLANNHFYPQTNFYFINTSKIEFLNNKDYINHTYEYIKTIFNYNGKVWEYIEGWSCENFLKQTVTIHDLKKSYLTKNKHNQLCETINLYKIGDPSHKNIMIQGICHYQFNNQNILKI